MTKIEIGVMVLMLAISFFFVYMIGSSYKDYESKKNYVESTEGLTYYYNGEEVDGDSVDLDLYRWTVDEDKKKVYLTDTTGSKTNIVPMPLPVR